MSKKMLEGQGNDEGQIIVERVTREITLAEVFGGRLPTHKQLREGQNEYAELGAQKLYISVVKYADGKTEVIAMGPKVKPEIISALFYFAAPSKDLYGFDRVDTRDDWRDLYQDPSNATRLAHHRMIPSWELFEFYKDELWQAIDGFLRKQPAQNEFTAVIRFVIDSNDQASWVFDDLASSGYKQAAQEHAQRLEGLMLGEMKPTSLSVALGLCLGFALAPEITQKWLKRGKHGGPGTQNLGATQLLPWALANRDDFFQSEFFGRLREYALEGTIPAAKLGIVLSAQQTGEIEFKEDPEALESAPKQAILAGELDIQTYFETFFEIPEVAPAVFQLLTEGPKASSAISPDKLEFIHVAQKYGQPNLGAFFKQEKTAFTPKAKKYVGKENIPPYLAPYLKTIQKYLLSSISADPVIAQHFEIMLTKIEKGEVTQSDLEKFFLTIHTLVKQEEKKSKKDDNPPKYLDSQDF
jgi:hypothetical protein